MNAGAIRCPTLLTGPRGGEPIGALDLDAAGLLTDAVLAWRDGVVTFAGPAARFYPAREGFPEPMRVQGAVVPGFVDCHTHLPFRGWRSEEFEARLAGLTYRDLHGGGGIFRSARLLAEASDDDVIAFCLPLAGEMLAHGTTAVELKTGYGLSIDRELRQARLARRLASKIPQTATVTLLACHAVPSDRAREDWVEEVCERLIPEAAGEELADAVDVYVEDIAFSVEDLESVAEAAARHGLALRCHADQLGPSGAAEAAVRLGARGADHLNHLSRSGVEALGRRGTVAVLLPVSTLFLHAKPPPVEDLIAAGAALAVATDFNPGTSPCLSVPEALSVGASLYGLSPLAGMVAGTHNAAWVLGLQGRHGSLQPGARADFVVLDALDPAMVAYRPGHNPVRETWIGGERAHS
ncbi:imidazolonepropionase [soil metagenome]